MLKFQLHSWPEVLPDTLPAVKIDKATPALLMVDTHKRRVHIRPTRMPPAAADLSPHTEDQEEWPVFHPDHRPKGRLLSTRNSLNPARLKSERLMLNGMVLSVDLGSGH